MLFILLALSLMLLGNKLYTKKIFIFNFILILCLSFNYIKNIKRIYDTNFYNNPYEHIKKVEWYRIPTEKRLQNFQYYIGWIDAHPVGNMVLDNYKYKKKLGFDIIYK